MIYDKLSISVVVKRNKSFKIDVRFRTRFESVRLVDSNSKKRIRKMSRLTGPTVGGITFETKILRDTTKSQTRVVDVFMRVL